MPSISPIRLNKEETVQNMRNVLALAVKKERGYLKDLKCVDKTGGEQVEKFASAGFIKMGYTPTEKTYAITDLGREYFSDFFAKISEK